MPIDGLLAKWNDDRGYGFIAPTVGGQEIFIHISAFPNDGRRPKIGELLAFDIETDSKGRKRAKSVTRPVRAAAVRVVQREHAKPGASRGLSGRIASLLILIAIGAYGYHQFSRNRDHHPFAEDAALMRIESPVAVPSPSTNFKCDGRTHCSHMTSCAEAKFFLQNCPATKMDSDGDGIPCERQWC